MSKLLFILKKRQKSDVPGTWNYTEGDPLDSGLFISAKQIVQMLSKSGVDVHMVQVIDNNEIDKWVALHRPTHVIIEALWVVPEKFDVLKRLHPTVIWLVRNHSKVDFLAHEGVVMGWIVDYLTKGIYVGCNSQDAVDDFKELARILGLDQELVVLLPNFYNLNPAYNRLLPALEEYQAKYGNIELPYITPTVKYSGILSVGCFGALRPLKNHMVQALAALNIADYYNLELHFHTNTNRIEGQAGGILKALRSMFSKFGRHKLIEIPWLPHNEFLEYMDKNIDILTQVSLSETFNIICADATELGIPILTSDQIPWLATDFIVTKPNNVQDITSNGILLWNRAGNGLVQVDQLIQLYKYCNFSKNTWLEFFK